MNAEDFIVSFKRDMAALSRTERLRAIESVRDVLRGALFDDAAGVRYDAESCPRCGSIAVVKKGKEAGSVIATDKAPAYAGVLAELGVAAHAAYDSKDRSKGTINRINAVHSLLAAFMEPFRGVSTKHLDAYLAWFEWCRTFMAAGSKAAEKTVARQLAHGSCRTRVRELFNVEPPYMDYWDAAA